MNSLNLQAEIDERSGFCFGVVEAIKKAEEALEKNGELCCLGEIVHNDEEIKRLERKGMRTIYHEDFAKINNKAILFRAHGEPPKSYLLAKKNHNTIVDAACPIIKKLQERIVSSYKNGENILLYGKHNHPEVIALDGSTNNHAIIFQGLEELKEKDIPKQVTLYSQTTQPIEKFKEIAQYLKNNGYEVKVNDTICRQVSNRQPEITKFCQMYDKIVFVAGKRSSNGKVLYSVCKKANANAYFVSTVSEIKEEWFRNGDTVGISGATSTPRWLMEEVKKFIENL
jgi:4-hydroxy-3-methylbut-2-enyl diphosphate reductase